MAKPLRPKRGTTAKNDAFTGLASEITIDTEKHSIRVHDSVTAGGHEILPKEQNDELYAPKGSVVTSVNGNTGDITPEQTGCLPLSGGKITGAITTQSDGALSWTNGAYKCTMLLAGEWGTSAGLSLRSKDATSETGFFNLLAADSTQSKLLQGRPDGTLTWGGKSLLSSAYQIPFGTCSTSSTVSEKVATITNGATFSLEPGSIVAIKFSHDPSNFTTLNVNSSGAKEVRKHLVFGEMQDTFSNGFIAIAPSNLVFVFVFDGTYWNLVTAYGEGEIFGIS